MAAHGAGLGLVQMHNGMKREDAGGALARNRHAARTGRVDQRADGRALEIAGQRLAGRLLDFKAADVSVIETAGGIGRHPRGIKRVLRAVHGHERALAGVFHKTVTAAVVLIRGGDGGGDPPAV